MVDQILQYVFGGLGLIFLAAGYFAKRRRWSFITAAGCSLSAAAAAHYDAFWVLATFALCGVWALVCALPVMDFGWRVKTGFVAAIGLGAALCVWPTIESMSDRKIPCPEYVRNNIPFRLVAGLDLRGGLRLVYTVDVEEAIKDKRDRYFDEMRQQLATEYAFHTGDKPPTREELAKLEEKVRLEKPRDKVSVINITFAEPSDDAKIDEKFLKRFQGEMAVQRPRKGVAIFKIRPEVESRFRESAVNQAKDTINRRVDELGLREAAVTVRDEDIIIEVPGEDERTFKEIRDIISQTARLEFKMLDDSTDFIGQATRGVKEEDLPKGVSVNNIENAPVGPGQTKPTHYAVVQKQPNETMKEARARLAEWISTLNVPDDHELGYEVSRQTDPDGLRQTEVGWRTYYLYSKADITGDMLRDAQAVPDQSGRGLGGWYVALTFTEAGGDRFEEVTGANVKRRFAIILDGKVESAPVIQTRIAGGHASITLGANDTESQLEEARKLELVLRSGALPAPISPSNEQRIGPSLGQDAIAQGVKGAIVSSMLVLIFMVVYYHRAGAVADAAVLFNLLLQLAVLASFGASMTLPGIAGLALTIGIAVDANVLINERIREELRNGKSPRAAVDAGYEKAFSAILDGHVTTFISGLILAQYGTGPIKGFAVTLIVGILASLFTGVVCTRLVFDWWVRGRKIKTLNIG
ncbi:MAG TPA: protein translocase subunit SecD [Polyangiaceae bacterium]|nr:protein translocase subunit SecD [Polyangiaceae bacterium]